MSSLHSHTARPLRRREPLPLRRLFGVLDVARGLVRVLERLAPGRPG